MIRILAALATLLASLPALAQQPPVYQSGNTYLFAIDPNNAAFQGEFTMTLGVTYAPVRSLKANCTGAGTVSVTYPDASTGLWQVGVGIQTIPVAAIAVNAGSTTATCIYKGLK